jgi:hypothetical protein
MDNLLYFTNIKMKNTKVRINVEDEQEWLFWIYVWDDIQAIVRWYDLAKQTRDEYEQRQYDIEEAAMDMEWELEF